MRLPNGMRQVLAGLIAAGAFLGLYFPLSLQWHVALGLGVVIYFAVLIAVPRRPMLQEIVVGDRVSAADIAAATDALTQAERRLTKSAERAPDHDRRRVIEMIGHLASLREQIAVDPADYRRSHRFISSYLPRMVENVEAYLALAGKNLGQVDHDRLAQLRDSVMSYAEVVARIDRAGLDNDLRALEAEVDALGFQLKRG